MSRPAGVVMFGLGVAMSINLVLSWVYFTEAQDGWALISATCAALCLVGAVMQLLDAR